MSFAAIPDKKTYKKASYLSIKAGKPVLFQLLDEKAERSTVHTITTSDGLYIKVEHDPTKEIFSDAGFVSKYKPRTIFRTNVLNVTPVVINPANGSVWSALNGVGNIPETDPADGTPLRGIPVKPLNEVQILESGVMLFGQINSQIETLTHTKDNFDHREVVFQGQATGQGRQKQTVIFFRPDIPSVSVEQLDALEKLDLEIPSFTDTEIRSMAGGTGVREIWDARKNADDSSGGFSSPVAPASGLDYSGGLPGLG